MHKSVLFAALFPFLLTSCTFLQKEADLHSGMTISKSITIRKDTFRIDAPDSFTTPVLLIEGNNITVDFNGSVLVGSNEKKEPDKFFGLAILVKTGKNVTIKNATIRGFKVALMAEKSDSLKILNSDFSYNYRQKLKSTSEREDLSDWMSYHQNDGDEWLRYGAGIYLKNCQNALVKGVLITGGQNGLMMSRCDGGLFYNNAFNFNSGIGIGLYRSSHNKVMHNKLDWNVRGYSHGFYSRGQDSAGILVYEQSNENVFAYNSATHSGDGFFLWAGQTTMDSGKGGCNDNLIYGNDFSHAPTNGVEVTFSSNKVIGNKMNDCTYGLWGGYSWKTLILGNEIKDCHFGVAIEHGQKNAFVSNYFEQDTIGIQLWERKGQPKDWGYSKNKDVSSKDYRIGANVFNNVYNPLKISSSNSVVVNDANHFYKFGSLLLQQNPNPNFYFVKNRVYQNNGWKDAKAYKKMNAIVKRFAADKLQTIAASSAEKYAPEKLPDGIPAFLPKNHLRGREYILVNEWGPYDFRYPVIWLRKIEGNKCTFILLGPQGKWKSIDDRGLTRFGPKTGTFPATIQAELASDANVISLELEFTGEDITDQLGRPFKKGTVFPFSFHYNPNKKDEI